MRRPPAPSSTTNSDQTTRLNLQGKGGHGADECLSSAEPVPLPRQTVGRLRALIGCGVTQVRSLGLWAGVDIDPEFGTGKQICLALAERGVLAKDTHGSTIRLAPPLVIEVDELDWTVDQLAADLPR